MIDLVTATLVSARSESPSALNDLEDPGRGRHPEVIYQEDYWLGALQLLG